MERSGGVERRGLRRNTKRKGGGELVLERIIWMRNTTPRAPTHTCMEVPCAQQLCLIRRIVLAATGSLYTPPPLPPPPLQAHRYISAWSACVHYISLRVRATTWSLPSLSTFLLRFSFFLSSFLPSFFSLSFIIILSPHSGNLPLQTGWKSYYNESGTMRELGQVALCQSRSVWLRFQWREKPREQSSIDLPPPLHDKIRYEILTSELHTGIQGKNYGSSNINYHIPCLRRFHAPPINRFIATPRKFSFLLPIQITRICGLDEPHDRLVARWRREGWSRSTHTKWRPNRVCPAGRQRGNETRVAGRCNGADNGMHYPHEPNPRCPCEIYLAARTDKNEPAAALRFIPAPVNSDLGKLSGER